MFLHSFPLFGSLGISESNPACFTPGGICLSFGELWSVPGRSIYVLLMLGNQKMQPKWKCKDDTSTVFGHTVWVRQHHYGDHRYEVFRSIRSSAHEVFRSIRSEQHDVVSLQLQVLFCDLVLRQWDQEQCAIGPGRAHLAASVLE
jgi:hypothetical protein